MTHMTLVVRAQFALIEGDLRPAAVAVAGDRIVDIAGFNDEFDALSDVTLDPGEVLVLAEQPRHSWHQSRSGIRIGARADLVAWGRGAHDASFATHERSENIAVPAT